MTDPNMRFWAKVQFGTDDECWLWLGCVERSGHGRFRVSGNRAEMAHRYAYESAFGAFDIEKCVCHACDNPQCVNPKHLWLGTKADNNVDRKIKGRNASIIGELNPAAKLTATEVLQIRSLIGQTLRQYQIAEMFGVTAAMVSDIKYRKSWTHI